MGLGVKFGEMVVGRDARSYIARGAGGVGSTPSVVAVRTAAFELPNPFGASAWPRGAWKIDRSPQR